MKFNDIVKSGLHFQTPGGKTGQVIGVEKDQTIAPVWRNRVEYFGWIVTARVDEKLVNIKFDTRDNFTGIKYNHEPPSKWRMKL